MIISMDAEKALDKIQYPSVKKDGWAVGWALGAEEEEEEGRGGGACMKSVISNSPSSSCSLPVKDLIFPGSSTNDSNGRGTRAWPFLPITELLFEADFALEFPLRLANTTPQSEALSVPSFLHFS